MRLYTFTNFMLNTISQGIQPGHLAADLLMKYVAPEVEYTPQAIIAQDWAQRHKTMICLNGGNYLGIIAISKVLEDVAPALGLPFAHFHEDMETLGGLMTCTGIIVPAETYERAAEMRTNRDKVEMPSTDPELRLIDLLNSCGLAR